MEIGSTRRRYCGDGDPIVGRPGPFAPTSVSRAQTRMPELKVAQGAWFDEDRQGITEDSDAK